MAGYQPKSVRRPKPPRPPTGPSGVSRSRSAASVVPMYIDPNTADPELMTQITKTMRSAGFTVVERSQPRFHDEWQRMLRHNASLYSAPANRPRWRDRQPGLYVLLLVGAVTIGVVAAVTLWPLTLAALVGYLIAVLIGRRHYRRVRSAAHWAAMSRRADEQNARWLKNGDLW